MDPNQDTVRSLADLLVTSDEIDDTSPQNRDSVQIQKQTTLLDDDSVFGEMVPDETSTPKGRTVHRMDDVHVSALKESRLERLDSLLSQVRLP